MLKTIGCICLSVFLIAVIAVEVMALEVTMYKITPHGRSASIGQISFYDTRYGLLIIPDIKNFPPGFHGFHIHQYPSCLHQGKAAGGHYDPLRTNKHLGPYNDRGHLGDMPVLVINKNGKADTPILAPRLKTKDLVNHAIILHQDGDNYSDYPEALGGGGSRLGCGIIFVKTDHTTQH